MVKAVKMTVEGKVFVTMNLVNAGAFMDLVVSIFYLFFFGERCWSSYGN